MAILAFFNGIFLRIVGLIMCLVMVWSVPPSRATTIEAKDPANVRLQASVFADVHMQSFTFQNFYQLASSLRDVGNAARRVDALVLLGDNTMNGQVTEYIMLYSLMTRFNRTRNTFVVMGNHDLALNTTNYRTAINRHNFFWRSYDRTRATEAYFSQAINGYTFMALAGEGPDDERQISDAQIAWLEATMEASPAGEPIFVFVHQNIEWFPRGEELQEILEQYDNVFVFYGHWHSPLALREVNGVQHVNVPGLHSHVSYDYAGEGLQIEVYDDHVWLRGRNFMAGEWFAAEFEIPLV